MHETHFLEKKTIQIFFYLPTYPLFRLLQETKFYYFKSYQFIVRGQLVGKHVFTDINPPKCSHFKIHLKALVYFFEKSKLSMIRLSPLKSESIWHVFHTKFNQYFHFLLVPLKFNNHFCERTKKKKKKEDVELLKVITEEI